MVKGVGFRMGLNLGENFNLLSRSRELAVTRASA